MLSIYMNVTDEYRLLNHGLRYNFLLHLFNLWDNSLLHARAIIDCMLIVDHYQVSIPITCVPNDER